MMRSRSNWLLAGPACLAGEAPTARRPVALFMGGVLMVGALLVGSPLAAQISVKINRVIQVEVEAEGTATQNCEGLREVLAGITDNSVANRYLVRLEAGKYDCGTLPLTVGRGITLEGLGELRTTIIGTIDSAVVGVVHLLDNATLRAVQVVNLEVEPDANAFAVSLWEPLGGEVHGARLDDVTLRPGNDYRAGASPWAVRGAGATFSVDRSTIHGSGILLENSNAVVSFTIFNGWGDIGTSTIVCRHTERMSGINWSPNCAVEP